MVNFIGFCQCYFLNYRYLFSQKLFSSTASKNLDMNHTLTSFKRCFSPRPHSLWEKIMAYPVHLKDCFLFVSLLMYWRQPSTCSCPQHTLLSSLPMSQAMQRMTKVRGWHVNSYRKPSGTLVSPTGCAASFVFPIALLLSYFSSLLSCQPHKDTLVHSYVVLFSHPGTW